MTAIYLFKKVSGLQGKARAKRGRKLFIISKERYCFVYRGQYFKLDKFINPPGLIILEIELTDRKEKIELPKFLRVAREATGDRRFMNFEIASN